MKSSQTHLYEEYHRDRRLQKRVISDNNFTYRELIKTLRPLLPHFHTMLDIGSGVGTIDFYLASMGKIITGMEISKKALSLAKRNAEIFGLSNNITYIQSTFPKKVPNKKFDLVLFSEVIEHLPNDEQILRDIRKVLSPKGFLVITTPSQDAPLFKLGLLKKFDLEVGHLRRYTQRGLTQLLIKTGYEVISIRTHEGLIRNILFTNPPAGKLLRCIRGPLSDIVTKLDQFSIRLFGASDIHVVAKKK